MNRFFLLFIRTPTELTLGLQDGDVFDFPQTSGEKSTNTPTLSCEGYKQVKQVITWIKGSSAGYYLDHSSGEESEHKGGQRSGRAEHHAE